MWLRCWDQETLLGRDSNERIMLFILFFDPRCLMENWLCLSNGAIIFFLMDDQIFEQAFVYHKWVTTCKNELFIE